MAQKMKVALGQLRPILGNVAANVDKHLQWMEQAHDAGAVLIVFPELGLTGYQVQDLTLDVARTVEHEDIQRIVAASADIDVVFSFVEESCDHLFYVTAIYAAKGQVVAKHRKVYLPTYGLFDEGRYFAAGHQMRAFSSEHERVGILLCEDAWHVTSPNLLVMDGANLLILPSASPSRSVTDQEHFGSHTFWRQLLQVYSKLFGVNLIFVNRVGFEDGVSFYGGSCVISPEGEWLVEASQMEEILTFTEIDLTAVRRARYATPNLRDERPDVIVRELERLLDGQRS